MPNLSHGVYALSNADHSLMTGICKQFSVRLGEIFSITHSKLRENNTLFE